MVAFMSVPQAAALLGVNRQRIHQRIQAGSLPAQKVGGRYILGADDVHRLRGSSMPGRPMSAKSAWDMIVVADGEGAAQLNPVSRSRARGKLDDLLAALQDVEPDVASARLQHVLGNRAERCAFEAPRGDLSDLRCDARIQLSGVCVPESNLSAGEFVEGYVASHDAESLIRDFLLVPVARAQANVILHVVPPDQAQRIPARAGLSWAQLAIAADLAEHDGPRERFQALALARLALGRMKHTTLHC
jgi:excisionase family DNA binding protein